jgi:polysaccharide chain length determinant protein (PEP-CTERM system associated)
VYVDTQGILKPLLAGLAVQPNVEQQIVMMTRTLISRPNVENVIRMSGLDVNVNNQKEKERLIDRLSSQIELRGTGKDNLYTIAYSDPAPQVAKKVVQSLLTIFVESSQGSKRKDADQARRFIDEQLRGYEQRLTLAENALKEFKQKNLGFAPGEGPGKDYFSRLNDTAAALSQARLDLREAENARDAMRKQLDVPAPVSEKTASPELEARIQSMRKNLDNLRLNYTEEHPDIVATKRVLEQLELQKQKELAERKSPMDGLKQTPAYQQMQLSLAESEAKVAALQARATEYDRRYAELRAAAGKVPEVEAEYTQLNRDYAVTKQNYEALVARRESAQLSGDMDSNAGVMDFRIIDPARVPLSPSFPNRPLLSSAVLLAGILGGIALAFVLSQVRPTFTDRQSLREATGLPILGSVTMIWTEAQRARHKRNLTVLAASYAGLLVSYAGVIATYAMLARAT